MNLENNIDRVNKSPRNESISDNRWGYKTKAGYMMKREEKIENDEPELNKCLGKYVDVRA